MGPVLLIQSVLEWKNTFFICRHTNFEICKFDFCFWLFTFGILTFDKVTMPSWYLILHTIYKQSIFCADIRIFDVFVFLSNVLNTNGTKVATSGTNKQFPSNTSTRWRSFTRRRCYRRHWRCTIGQSTFTLAGHHFRTSRQPIWGWKIFSVHRDPVSVSTIIAL